MSKIVKNTKSIKHVKTTKTIKTAKAVKTIKNASNNIIDRYVNDGQLEDSNDESINEPDNDIENEEQENNDVNDNEEDNNEDDDNEDDEYGYEEDDDGEDGEDGEDDEDGAKKYTDKKCIYNFTGDNEDNEENEIVDDVVFDDDIIEEINDIVPSDERRTKPVLFKYERCRIIGDRTQQITLGAKPMIKNTEGLNPKQIAELELENNVLPLIIQRPLPNGKKERWYIHELKH